MVEGYAFLNGALLAAGLSAPNADTQGAEILKSWECDYAEGHVRNALASAANDPSNTAGQPLIDAFMARLQWIIDHGTQAGAMLESGDAPAASSRIRSYPVNNVDDLSIDDGDFDPAFTNSPDQW